MEFVPALAMLALVVKLIDFARYARAGDMNGIVTQLAAWLAGILVFLLVAQTAWADGIEIGDRPMSKLGVWSLVFAGMSIASGASVVKDAITSRLNEGDTVPRLLAHRANRPV